VADFIQPFDPTVTSSGFFDCSLKNGGWLIVHNESPIELQLSSGSTLAAFLVAAYTIRAKKIPLNVSRITWLQAGNISGGGQAPISLVFAEACAPDEWTGGEIYLPLVRLTNVGNQSSGATTSDIVNDGNAPGTSIAEATPSDQVTSSVKDFNDASGFRKVLSANVLRTFWNVLRGNASALKAVFTLGDSGDATLLTVYGSLQGGQPANVGALTSGAITGTGANSFDDGNDTTDGSGNHTAKTFSADGPASSSYFKAAIPSTTGDQNGVMDMIDNTAGAVHWQVGKQAHANGDNFRVIDATHGAEGFHVSPNSGGMGITGPLAVTGVVSSVAGVTTAGAAGVVLCVDGVDDANITNTSLTNTLTYTTPNDGKNHDYEVNADLFVGAANTNNGTVTLQVAYTDPHEGALTLPFNVYSQVNPISAIAQQKGKGVRTDVRAIRSGPNQTITVQYRNTAAGTISDFSSAKVKMIG
jgi:hypothetical protein